MKKTLLLLTLSAFLASPMTTMPEAHAADQGKPRSHKVNSHKLKTHKAKPGKIKAKTKKAVLKSRGKTIKAKKRIQAAYNPHTPLRVMNVSYGNALQDGDLDLKSAAALVVDQKSGEALYAKNTDVATPIASITKLMTAMVTLDASLPLDEEITISSEDMDRLKGTGSRLALGTRLTRAELLNLALIASENRAAAALTRAYPGGPGGLHRGHEPQSAGNRHETSHFRRRHGFEQPQPGHGFRSGQDGRCRLSLPSDP